MERIMRYIVLCCCVTSSLLSLSESEIATRITHVKKTYGFNGRFNWRLSLNKAEQEAENRIKEAYSGHEAIDPELEHATILATARFYIEKEAGKFESVPLTDAQKKEAVDTVIKNFGCCDKKEIGSRLQRSFIKQRLSQEFKTVTQQIRLEQKKIFEQEQARKKAQAVTILKQVALAIPTPEITEDMRSSVISALEQHILRLPSEKLDELTETYCWFELQHRFNKTKELKFISDDREKKVAYLFTVAQKMPRTDFSVKDREAILVTLQNKIRQGEWDTMPISEFSVMQQILFACNQRLEEISLQEQKEAAVYNLWKMATDIATPYVSLQERNAVLVEWEQKIRNSSFQDLHRVTNKYWLFQQVEGQLNEKNKEAKLATERVKRQKDLQDEQERVLNEGIALITVTADSLGNFGLDSGEKKKLLDQEIAWFKRLNHTEKMSVVTNQRVIQQRLQNSFEVKSREKVVQVEQHTNCMRIESMINDVASNIKTHEYLSAEQKDATLKKIKNNVIRLDSTALKNMLEKPSLVRELVIKEFTEQCIALNKIEKVDCLQCMVETGVGISGCKNWHPTMFLCPTCKEKNTKCPVCDIQFD